MIQFINSIFFGGNYNFNVLVLMPNSHGVKIWVTRRNQFNVVFDSQMVRCRKKKSSCLIKKTGTAI